MDPPLFVLHDSLKGRLLAKGAAAVAAKCLLAILKGTFAFFGIAFVAGVVAPENYQMIGHLAQLLVVWIGSVSISVILALRPNYAIGGRQGVGFDTFSSYEYESCQWNELEFVAIRYYSVGVTSYTFAIAKAGRRQHRIDLFVHQSYETMIQVKETLEGQDIRVAFEDCDR